MTELDIEKERREFEAWQSTGDADLERSIEDPQYYADRETNCEWHAWLAAKRAVQGSAEPVAMKDAPARIYLVIEDGGDAYKSFADAKKQADMSDGIMWCEDRQSGSDVPYVRADLTAPPAPVSAEPNPQPPKTP